jgi:isoleucyl-tRNA synthetase
MQQVILLGRQRREEVKIGIRTPLKCLTIIHRDEQLLHEIGHLEDYVKSELNVLEVRYESDETAYIELTARPNFPVLGKRLGKRMKEFQAAIGALSAEDIAALQESGEVEIDGERFDLEEIQVQQQPRDGTTTVSNRFIAVDLDCELNEGLVRGGYAREIVNRIQQRRKEMNLNVSDRIRVVYDGDPEILKAAEEHREQTASATLAVSFLHGDVVAGRKSEIDGREFVFRIEKA